MNDEYSDAAVEVLDILNNTNKEDVAKIPSDFIEFLKEISSKNYVVNLDHSKPIRELEIKEETKEILGTIYINWWCDNKQKEQYKKQMQEQEEREQEELREKYNPNDIFKNKKSIQISNEIEEFNSRNETLLIVNNKENIIKRIINKFIKIFTTKKN